MNTEIQEIQIDKYPTYKDSGVEWLGEIPEHWEVKRLKNLGYIYAGLSGKSGSDFDKVYKESFNPFIPFTTICNFSQITEANYQYVKVDENEVQNIVKKNDLLFLMSSETIEDIARCSIYLREDKVFLNSFCKAFRIESKKLNPIFANYLIGSAIYRAYFNTVGRGFTRINIKQEYINQVSVVIPPLPEQTAIANFLDDRCSKIDAAVEIKQQQIALLKERRQIAIHQAVTQGLDKNVPLKDSGVEWIGEIPEHWQLTKVKQCSSKISKGTTPSTEGREILEEGNIRFLKSENIFEGAIVEKPLFFIDEKTDFIMKRSSLEVNDVLFVIAGASLGKVAVVTDDVLPANTNQAVAFIRSNKKILSYFLSRYLVSNTINELTWLEAVQSAQPNLSMESLGNFPVSLPPLSEQQAIVTHLEEFTSKIDSAIALYQQEIEKLKEYKTTLINSAVTGKIKVPGVN